MTIIEEEVPSKYRRQVDSWGVTRQIVVEEAVLLWAHPLHMTYQPVVHLTHHIPVQHSQRLK